jgi:malonyl CoA-acyl carrier protein transacylase
MRTLLLFDGLGGSSADLVTRLREQYARPENRAFFTVVCGAVEAALDHVGEEAYRSPLPEGLALRDWLRAPSGPAATPTDSVTVGVCTHAYQLCQLQPAGPSSDDVVAALGLSLGLQAAIVAGMGVRRPDAYLDLCDRSMRLVVLALIRGHQVTEADTVDPGLAREYARRHPGAHHPTPMASVTGVGTDALADAVARHNTRVGPGGAGGVVEVGLIASPRTHMLSARADDLLDFHFAHERLLTGEGGGWAFLRNTLPFHSARMTPARHRDERDLAFVGPPPGGHELRFPVYATDAPRNLQDSADLSAEFVDLMMVRPVDWPATVAHAMHACGPDRAVDFGPGPAARVFTRDCLRSGGPRLRFESGPRALRSPRALQSQGR